MSKLTISAKVIADSVSVEGKRITTMQLCYPRFIHAENKTHRVLSSDSENEVFVVQQSSGLMDDPNLSRNASSSRAIPVAKMIEQVRTNPAMPIHWGKNRPGMQADSQVDGLALFNAKDTWREAAIVAANLAERMSLLGLHKQVANRILEPFQWIHVIVTATEWGNFFELRAHADAQPEIRELAIRMQAAMDASTPVVLRPGEWHLPYITEEDRDAVIGRSFDTFDDAVELLCKVSAARCCRVSYLKHDGTPASIEEELALCDRLVGARPLHASPFEHQATPDVIVKYHVGNESGDFDAIEDWQKPGLHGNFVGWVQYRKLIEDQFKQ